MADTWTVTAVARVPTTGSPIFSELGALYCAISFDEGLNEAGTATLSMNVRTVTENIKARLRDLSAAPMEVWIYKNSTMQFAGPVTGGSVQGQVLSLTARGILFYTDYMHVETDKTFAAVDEWTVATELISDWQSQNYGDYGIDTSGVGTSGTTMSIVIPGASEFPKVLETIKGMSVGRFDISVDPTTRALTLEASKGSDLSASVFLDIGIESADINFAVTPGIVASEVYGVGTNAAGSPLTTTKTNSTIEATFGKAGHTESFDPVTDATHLSDLTDGDLAKREGQLFVPGAGLIGVPGATLDDFGVGDTVTYSFDAGLGLQTFAARIARRSVTIDEAGVERIAVQFGTPVKDQVEIMAEIRGDIKKLKTQATR